MAKKKINVVTGTSTWEKIGNVYIFNIDGKELFVHQGDISNKAEIIDQIDNAIMYNNHINEGEDPDEDLAGIIHDRIEEEITKEGLLSAFELYTDYLVNARDYGFDRGDFGDPEYYNHPDIKRIIKKCKKIFKDGVNFEIIK